MFWKNNFIKNELGDDILLGLIGNKFDLFIKEEVSEEMGKSKAMEWEAYFSLLSAKDDKGEINNFFIEIVKLYLHSLDDEFLLIESKTSIKKVSLKNLSKIDRDTNDNCCGGKNVKNEEDIKIIFFGAKGVGKTQIIQAIRGNGINKKYIETKKITKNKYIYNLKDKQKVNVNIYDTAGNCEFNDELKNLCKKCKIFFFVFDINKKETFHDLESYLNKIKDYTDENKIIINILGNKTKLLKGEVITPVTQEEGEQLAKKYKGHFEIVCVEEINLIKDVINKNIENL